MNSSACIIPGVLLVIVIEFLIARLLNKKVYHYKSTIVSLSIGTAERLLNLWCLGIFYFLFNFIYTNYSLFIISNTWYNWIILLLITDFVWYWYHRLGHEINILWAFHIVHHQSEDYNYATSTRITIFQAIIINFFWCLLPLICFNPGMVVIVLVIHGTYSFLTHTQIIDKLGWLEYILITPSHHRVHHASNEEYLDKNYGDIFIFWDVLFGTFKKEDIKPIYGLTKPIESYSFLWQHFHYLMEIVYRLKRTEGLVNKVKILFGRPDQLLGNEREELEKVWLYTKQIKEEDTEEYGVLKIRTKRYVKYIEIQLGVVLASLFLLTLYSNVTNSFHAFFSTLLILLTLINCSALLEQRKWIFFLEYMRLIVTLVYLSVLFNLTSIIVVCLFIVALITNFYQILREKYLRLIFY
jgi:alkylglycerol monooxygenase